jgi:hypothetical protein
LPSLYSTLADKKLRLLPIFVRFLKVLSVFHSEFKGFLLACGMLQHVMGASKRWAGVPVNLWRVLINGVETG